MQKPRPRESLLIRCLFPSLWSREMWKLSPTVPGANLDRHVSLCRRLCLPLCSCPGEGEWCLRVLNWAASKGTGHRHFSCSHFIWLRKCDQPVHPDGRLVIRALAPQDSLQSVEVSGLGRVKWDGAFNGRWFLVRVAVWGWEKEHWEYSLEVWRVTSPHPTVTLLMSN